MSGTRQLPVKYSDQPIDAQTHCIVFIFWHHANVALPSIIMDYFSVNQVRLGDGRPAAQYAVCVPDHVLNKALESDTKLRKHLPSKNDKHFLTKAAAILGGIICADDCSGRFNQWVLSAIPEATALLQKPTDLGERTPSMVENEYPGVKIWLLKTEVNRMPNYF